MMSMELSIVHNIDLVKALNELKSFNTYTACVRNNILRIIESCFFGGYRGKTVDFARYSDRHRTSLAHFLNKGKWDSAALEKDLRESVIEKVYQHSRETNAKPLRVKKIVKDLVELWL